MPCRISSPLSAAPVAVLERKRLLVLHAFDARVESVGPVATVLDAADAILSGQVLEDEPAVRVGGEFERHGRFPTGLRNVEDIGSPFFDAKELECGRPAIAHRSA